jgi:hypothetical protein
MPVKHDSARQSAEERRAGARRLAFLEFDLM